MTTITGNQTHGNARVDGSFDALVVPDRVAQPTAIMPADGALTIEQLMLSEPSRPHASLTTVASVFLAISIVQVAVLAVSAATFDLSAFRLVLAYVIFAPAAIYTIVAAWDHRQLISSGWDSAPRWEWALVFPPIYLTLRWLRVRGARRNLGAAIGWAVAQLAVTVAFVVFAATALVMAPVQQAVAVPASGIVDVTASVVEQQVAKGWADAGDTGTASCAEPASQDPGTPISCTGVFEGNPVEFTAVIGDWAAGDAAVIISRWSEGVDG